MYSLLSEIFVGHVMCIIYTREPRARHFFCTFVILLALAARVPRGEHLHRASRVAGVACAIMHAGRDWVVRARGVKLVAPEEFNSPDVGTVGYHLIHAHGL